MLGKALKIKNNVFSIYVGESTDSSVRIDITECNVFYMHCKAMEMGFAETGGNSVLETIKKSGEDCIQQGNIEYRVRYIKTC